MVTGLESAWLAIYVRVLGQPMGSFAGQNHDCGWFESFVVFFVELALSGHFLREDLSP